MPRVAPGGSPAVDSRAYNPGPGRTGMDGDVTAEDTTLATYDQWLRAMARGDEQALGSFYDATLSRSYALALRIVRDREAAEDVVAETYLQVWREAQRYDSTRGNALAWLLTICRSRALDYLRRLEPVEFHAEPDSLPGADVPRAVATEDLVSALQEGHRVREAVAQLPPVQRQLLALAFFRGLSHQEIAEHSGLPLGTVKSHIRKAQEALRLVLEKS
jgi:RNA polymerase sigma factor (sigma-70 family)